MWTLKCDTNESIYETETELQTIEKKLVVSKGGWVREEWSGRLGLVDISFYI